MTEDKGYINMGSAYRFFKNLKFKSAYRIVIFLYLSKWSGSKMADHWLQRWNIQSNYGLYEDNMEAVQGYVEWQSKLFRKKNERIG